MLKAVCIMLGVAVNALPADVELAPNGRRTTFATLGGHSKLNSLTPTGLKTFVIKNSCTKSIFVRKGPLDKGGDACPNMQCTPEQTIEPGGSKVWDNFEPIGPFHNIIVLSWGDYHNVCAGATFCTQLESNPAWQMNFAHQRGFSMDVGVAYYVGGQGGRIPSNCPVPAFKQPNWPEASLKTNVGKMDTCKWDVKRDCPESAFLVATSAQAASDGGPFYCVSPDDNLAVISELMENPTKAECAQPAPPPAKSPRGDRPLCKRRDTVAITLIQKNQLWDAEGKALSAIDFTDPSDERKAGGAKDYQHAVNKGCLNQPPTQRVEWADASKTNIKYNQGYQDQGRTIPKGSGEKFLDHGVSYEGDDSNYYRIDANVSPVYFSGDIGIKCPFEDFDTVVLEACPA